MPSKLCNWPEHPVFAATASAKGKAKRTLAEAGEQAKLGTMPEWALADLYQAPDSPKLKADLQTSERAAEAMQERYAGKLATLLDGGKGGAALAQAVREFEALNDIMGRIVSYASLLYAADTSDPKRQKFFGDIQEKITAISSKLLFFPLELNRLDDAMLETAMTKSELGHYRPWLEDLRKEKPYQLDDKLEQLFHEKAVTARGAWDRLFNETMTSLRFEADGEKLSLEPTLNRLLDPDENEAPRRRRSLGQGVQGQCAAVHADHQHARQGQGDLGPLARLRRRRRLRAISPTASRRRWSTRWWRPCARLIRASRTATTR